MRTCHTCNSRSATRFNGDVSTWSTENVNDFGRTFRFSVVFNGDLSAWDTSAATSMANTFESAHLFTGAGLGAWDVSNVKTMRYTFQRASIFNADVSTWNVAQVVYLHSVFLLASEFSQDLSQWNVGKVSRVELAFAGTKLTGCHKAAMWESWGMSQGNAAFVEEWWMWDPDQGETWCSKDAVVLPCRPWEKRDVSSGTCSPALWLDWSTCMPGGLAAPAPGIRNAGNTAANGMAGIGAGSRLIEP